VRQKATTWQVDKVKGERVKMFGRLVLASIGLVAVAGCGGERFPVAPVSGKVTLDGEPLAGARIGFEPRRQGESPNAGPGSYGKTDAQGRYELTTLDGRSGAVVGTHDVWIRTYQAKADRASGEPVPAVEERVPARYNENSILTFEVPPEGTDAADFELSSDS